jgi:hypothetical protein
MLRDNGTSSVPQHEPRLESSGLQGQQEEAAVRAVFLRSHVIPCKLGGVLRTYSYPTGKQKVRRPAIALHAGI